MLNLIKKLFGTAQSRRIKKFQEVVDQINLIEKNYQALSDELIKEKSVTFKERIKGGESLDQILPEAYALVKNVCRRLCGTEISVMGHQQKWEMIPYDVQLLGAIGMHYGAIAEMMTGEGKTLTAAMPLFLNALSGRPVYLVTVNDYLAKRDCEWIGTIFRWLGLKTEALVNSTPLEQRREIYRSDIVYGTASEFGFDYLRDNSMALSKEEQCQHDFFFAIIDEVDSILIDEARTPLIISGPVSHSNQMYETLKTPVSRLVRMQRDYCSTLASKAQKKLKTLGCLEESPAPRKLSKEEAKEKTEATKNLWLVGKGTPQNKILKKVKEHPDLRGEIEGWETYFCAEANKGARYEMLAQLYMIIDERSSDHELTDKGIQFWSGEKEEAKDDFVMLDLGHEYGLIDREERLSDQEKLDRKNQVRKEDGSRKERAHNLRQLLRAHLLMEKDTDYIVADRKIVIIDENTGRPQPGRRFSDGLHQAIEAKEQVPIQRETQTYATITLQNYFRLFEKLAGMTGTAMNEATELKEIYKLDVLQIPTHKACQREDLDDEIYMTEREKYQAIIKEIIEIHGQTRPILIGTESVEISEKLSRILRQNRLKHTVLNAKNHMAEAETIAQAGKAGAITVATNMAGRGTDIKLEMGIAEKGGLHVIGTTRHQSRRIDLQLRGRCARQGDLGSSKFYVSFEDSLMRLFASPKLTLFLKRFRPPEGEPISARVLNRSIETAQKRVEQRNYTIRKHTLEYDDVMNKQRQEVYAFRNEVLREQELLDLVNEIIETVCSQAASSYFVSRSGEGGWDPKGYRDFLMSHFPVSFDANAFDEEEATFEEIEKQAARKIILTLKNKLDLDMQILLALKKQKGVSSFDFTEIFRNILLQTIDQLWQSHLLSIDHLRLEVGMSVIGQKDPLLEFKHEAFTLFSRFSQDLKLKLACALFGFSFAFPKESSQTSPVNRLEEMRSKAPHTLFSRAQEESSLKLHSKPIKTKKK